MATENTRRSDRIPLAVTVEVSGTDLNGQSFKEQTKTIVITRHGASITLNRKLAPGQELTICRVGTKKEAAFRIVEQAGRQAESYVYGVASQHESVNLWDIAFPPLTESEMALGRVLLECSRCLTREVVYLDEFELKAFHVTPTLSRPCKRCASSTPWQLASQELPPETSPNPAGPGTAAPVRDRPKEPGAKLAMTACVRQRGTDDTLVTTENISRTGLYFKTEKRFQEGTPLEVAVPYLRDAANIFIPARIVFCEELKAAGMFRYGVEYLKLRKD